MSRKIGKDTYYNIGHRFPTKGEAKLVAARFRYDGYKANWPNGGNELKNFLTARRTFYVRSLYS
jgi:hypothetical protein